MKIAIACDHGGYPLKEAVIGYLKEDGHELMDLGVHSEEVSVDYPQYGYQCAQAVAGGQAERGIVICGTGVGISIFVDSKKSERIGDWW